MYPSTWKSKAEAEPRPQDGHGHPERSVPRPRKTSVHKALGCPQSQVPRPPLSISGTGTWEPTRYDSRTYILHGLTSYIYPWGKDKAQPKEHDHPQRRWFFKIK